MESIRQFLAADHRRLDALLERTGECRTPEELAAYDGFRRGILKHIGIEEKILLTAAARLRGTPLEQAARLRLDHGAIVSLLMPIPTSMIIRAIRTVLDRAQSHRRRRRRRLRHLRELATAEHAELLAKILAAPEVPTHPNATTPRILDAARHALARAGYDSALIDD